MTEKTNEELAREAELSKELFLTNQCRARLDRFAALVEQRLIARLLEGVGEPELFFTENFGLGDVSNVWGYSPHQLAAAVLAYKQDADRYRWLREQNANLESGFSVNYEEVGLLEELQWIGSDLDAVIDAAIRGATT